MGSNEEIIRLAQEAEKQQLFAQKVQQQNTHLTSQLELYKERNRILEGINKDNNYLNEFLEADERAKRYNKQAQSQLVRDRDIIRDLKKQRDKLELDVKDHKRQKEEYQKTQTIFKQTQRDKEEKYLNDIFQLQAKIKDLENVVCKMGKSTDTLRLLTNEQKAFRDNSHKSGLGYNSPYVLSQAYAKIPKLYNAYELCNKSEQLHVFDSEETFKDAFKNQVKPILNEMKVYLEFFHNLFQRDIKEMKDVFESTESKLNDLEKQNELLKDQLLEASLAEDIKNLVITSCMEIMNKDLHDEIDRISKESNDVTNESKTADTDCNDAFGVTQELSKRIVELEKDLSKFEAKSIAFEIALQHKSRENNSLKTIQKENENFMASLQLENAHLKQNYKDLFESVQRTAKFEAYFEKLEKMKVVLERQLARKFVKTKFDKHSILGKPPADKLLINSQISKSWFTPKVDMQKSLSKPVTAQSLPKNEKDQFLKRIASLESKLASQDIHSCQKEYHELRTLYNALKVKFDSLNRKRRETNVSKSSKPRESVSAKVHTGESSKPFSRRVSQFTTYSLQKDRKFSKNSQSFETLTPQKGFKKRASNAKHQSFETTYSCFTPVKQVWRPIKESQTFEASTSQKSFKTRTLKGKNQVFDPHSRFTPVNQVWRPKQSHLKTFKYSKSEMFLLQNKNDLALKNKNNGRLSNASKTNFQNDTSNGNNKWKFSSSTRFKNSHETSSFKNEWKIKRNFKSTLIPRALFSNETPVSSPRWNSTSLHRIDTTSKWFSTLGKPVSTVLKWVPKLLPRGLPEASLSEPMIGSDPELAATSYACQTSNLGFNDLNDTW
ncbi:hypothetical protein Tco_0283113 [Tanacetum coccineum]